MPHTALAPVGGSGGVNIPGGGVTRNIVTNIVNALAGAGSGQIATQVVNNVTFTTNVTFLQQVTFSGKATFTSNVFLSSFNLATNQAAVTTLHLNGGIQYISTNDNVAYTGFTFLTGSGNTNGAWTTLFATNTAGALKTYTFAGTLGDATHYITNTTVFTVMKYPGWGTGVVSRPMN